MRVAVSGSHRTGKTSLIAAVADRVPGYEIIDEAYRVLEESGHEFSDPPSVDDFEQQLRTSLELVGTAPTDALLDRCPLDFVAYLQALDEEWSIDDWLDDIADAMSRLDLIVVVPIETPDRIAVAAHEDKALRRRVDERLQRLVLDTPLDVATLEVSGTCDERVRQVMRAITTRR